MNDTIENNEKQAEKICVPEKYPLILKLTQKDMAEKGKGSFWETLLAVGALVGGAWIAIELIKLFGKKTYTCPVCKNQIPEHTRQCPHCKTKLEWKI